MDSRFNVRTFLDPHDDEGHLIARRVSEKRVAELAARSAESVGDDFFPIEVTPALEPRFGLTRSRVPARRPWILKDAHRPAFRGAYATHELALRAMDNRVRGERGMPARLVLELDEIKAAMSA